MADSYYLFYLLYVVVAQLVEHLTVNQVVVSSNLSRSANDNDYLEAA